MQKTNIFPKTNSKYLAGVLYRLMLLFTIWAKLPDRVRRWELYSFLWRMIERCVILMGLLVLLHCAFSEKWYRANGQVPILQWFFLYYILWPNCYLKKPQHNFSRFLELFSNFLYLFATHTADRSVGLAQKWIKFHYTVCRNAPLMLTLK